MLRVVVVSLGVAAGVGCTVDVAPETASTGETGAATEAVTTTTTVTTTGASETTTAVTTTGASETTTAATTGETGGSETGESPAYCHGFQVDARAPFLDVHILGGELLADGVTLPLECGGQGSWMFGLYPGFGGWDPGTETVVFAVEVDVEGFNDNPAGHFFSGDVYYYIGCEDILGGVLGVVPVIPPDTLADLSQLDGKPATVRVTVDAGGQPLTVEADVTLAAPLELVSMGCMFF